jgi:fructose-1,6-bisphosphatase/inositol monophosphatase family enzyme
VTAPDPITALLERAGRVALASWRTADLDVQDKASVGAAPDLVSAVDLAVDRIVTDGLRDLHPGVPIISEEVERPRGDPPADAFVIDPIDGTHNFVSGGTLWTIALARTRGHEVEEAWIHHPPTGQTSHAVRGGVTTHAGRRVRVSGVTPRRGLVSVSLTRELMPLLLHSARFAGIRALGSHAFCLAAAARGEFILHAGGGKPWDVAAGFLLVERAGGRVCDLHGNPRSPFDSGRKGLAGAPGAVELALELIRG